MQPMEAVRHASPARETTQAAGAGAYDTVTGCPEEVEIFGVCCMVISFGAVVCLAVDAFMFGGH